MSEFLEWYQCKACGRRYRWRAEIAGQAQECVCGAEVFCPELDVFGAPEGPGDTLTAQPLAGLREAPAGSSLEPAFDEPEFVPAGPTEPAPALPERPRGAPQRGLFRVAIAWLVGVLLGIALVVHAIIVQATWSIISAAVWMPLSLTLFWFARERWQGGRSLRRAIEDELG
ncbi:MAG: hypothetical protein AAFX05_06245 [Planctomycetota bacterium]